MSKYFSSIANFFILGLIFSLSQTLGEEQNIDPEIGTQIDDFIRNVYLPATKTSSLGLSIVQNDGEVLFSTGYGYADQERMIMNRNDTRFILGSTTKSFTAIIVIKVLSEKFPDLGEKVLDTPIRKLIPSANFTLNDRFRSEQITFRDLLAHRTCILRDDLSMLAYPFNTSEEITYRLRYSGEACGIRSQFQYINQMFVFAGDLAGIIANRSYEDLLQDLLTDLGMFNSSTVKIDDDFSNKQNFALPYYVIENVSYPINTELINWEQRTENIYYSHIFTRESSNINKLYFSDCRRITPSNAAGGLYTTPNDMARYMRFHLNLGSLDGRQIVPEDVMKWLTKPAIAIAPFTYKTSEEQRLTSGMAYGLGLFLDSYDGWQYVQHSGYFPPYNSLMSLFPAKKVAVFTSSNQGSMLLNPAILSTFIYDLLIGANNATGKALERMENWQGEYIERKSRRDEAVSKFLEESKTAPKQNEDVFGKYGSGSAGDVEIFERFNNETNETGIYLSYGRWYQAWLENIGGSTYNLTWDSDVRQDMFAGGDPNAAAYATISNGTLDILFPANPVDHSVLLSMGKFEIGVSLDNLPPIPWAPESCGPEN